MTSCMNATFVSPLAARLMALIFALLGAAAAHASVVINNTRIIYPQDDKEVTVRLESKNRAPVLIQVWLDSGDEHATPDLASVPFIATPPIFRMEPGKQQVVRLAYTGEAQAANQESLFWFNLLEVPAHSQEANQLQLAFRSGSSCFCDRRTCRMAAMRHRGNCNGGVNQRRRAKSWRSSTPRLTT